MFAGRMGYYSIFAGIAWLTASELFGLEKNFFNKDGEERIKFILWCIIVSTYSIFLISVFPVVVNANYSAIQGEIVECKMTGKRGEHVIPWEDSADDYDIILKIENSDKRETYINVQANEKLSTGMNVVIYDYKAWPLETVLGKVNGKTAEYYQNAFRKSEVERIIAFGCVSAHAILLLLIITRTYVRGERKQKVRKYYYMGCAFSGIYGGAPWISYFYPDKSIRIGHLMGGMLAAYYMMQITIIGIIHRKEVQKNQEKEKIEEKQIANGETSKPRMMFDTEEIKTTSETEKQENEKTEEKQTINVEVSKSESIGTDYPICRFTPMSNILSRQYCAYRYKWEKKDWVKTMLIFPPVILGVLLFICSIFKPGFALVLIIEVEKRKLVAGVVLFWLLFIVLYSIHKRKKCKKFREAVRDNRPCESCKVTFVFDKEHRYIRSDGQERIESMGWDEDAKLKSGQDAVVVYIPFMDEFYTEMPETLKKVEKSIKN